MRYFSAAILGAIVAFAVGGALFGALAVQGAPAQPPQPLRPDVQFIDVADEPGDQHPENQLIDAQLTVGLLSDKPEAEALINYCPQHDEVIAAAGEILAYCYRLENRSEFTFTRHTIADSVLGIIVEDSPFTLTPTLIIQAVLTSPATATQTSFISWTAYAENSDAVTDFSNARVIVPRLVTTTTADIAPDVCGQTTSLTMPDAGPVTFCIRAYNTNPFSLTEHSLVDSLGNQILLPEGLELGPGELYTVTISSVVTEPLTYETTWTARAAVRQLPVTATSSASVRPPHIDAAITFGRASTGVCTSAALTVTEGTQVIHCYSAYNDGSVLLDKHRVVNDLLNVDYPFDYPLAPDTAVGIVVTRAVTASNTSRMTWYARHAEGAIVSDTVEGMLTVLPPAAVEVSTRLITDQAQPGRPIPNIRIRLVNADGEEQFQATNFLGVARFGNLLPGMYQLNVVTTSLKSLLSVVSTTPISVEITTGATVTTSFTLSGAVPGQSIHLPFVQR